MARLAKVSIAMVVVIVGMIVGGMLVEATTWCVAKSNASVEALQKALDYACAAEANCVAIQSPGPCYLPNTLRSHASYAFNSYYQRVAPGTCDFSGTATITMTNPSYGTCMYPPSAGTSGRTTKVHNSAIFLFVVVFFAFYYIGHNLF